MQMKLTVTAARLKRQSTKKWRAQLRSTMGWFVAGVHRKDTDIPSHGRLAYKQRDLVDVYTWPCLWHVSMSMSKHPSSTGRLPRATAFLCGSLRR